MLNKLIVFEGVDGSGKTTTIEHVLNKMRDNGKTAISYKFPVYDSPTGEMIKEILSKKTDTIPNNVFKLFALNRYLHKSHLEELIAAHDYVIVDRYMISNIVYSSAIQELDMQDIEEEYTEFEFDILQLPKWDDIYLIDISIEHLQNVISERSKTGDANDTDFELLVNVDRLYKKYFKKYNHNIVPFTDLELRASLIYDSILSLP